LFLANFCIVTTKEFGQIPLLFWSVKMETGRGQQKKKTLMLGALVDVGSLLSFVGFICVCVYMYIYRVGLGLGSNQILCRGRSLTQICWFSLLLILLRDLWEMIKVLLLTC
jgi:hypothetical protein